MKINIPELRSRVEHGFNLSNAEARAVLFLITGEHVPSRRRCESCNGNGGLPLACMACPSCHGAGYHAMPNPEYEFEGRTCKESS